MICKVNETKVIKRHWFYQDEENMKEELRSSITESRIYGTGFSID